MELIFVAIEPSELISASILTGTDIIDIGFPSQSGMVGITPGLSKRGLTSLEMLPPMANSNQMRYNISIFIQFSKLRD